MKEKIKIQKGFIQIPLLVIIIASIIVVSGAATGFYIYQEKIKEMKQKVEQAEELAKEKEEIAQQEIAKRVEEGEAKEKAEEKMEQEEMAKKQAEEKAKKEIAAREITEQELAEKEAEEKELNADKDGDGLTYRQELDLGTSDLNTDSDGDEIPDGEDSHPAGGGRSLISQYFEWDYGGSHWTWPHSFPSDWWDYYRDKEHGPHSANYVTYNNSYIKKIADMLEEKADENGYSKSLFAVAFIQSLGYVGDEVIGYDDYPKYPLETLAEQSGDCEDTSYLAAAIVRAMGISCVLVKLPDHMAVAIAFSDSLEGYYYRLSNGWDYYYIETTEEGWWLGEIPPEYKYTKATLIKIPSNETEEIKPRYIPFTTCWASLSYPGYYYDREGRYYYDSNCTTPFVEGCYRSTKYPGYYYDNRDNYYKDSSCTDLTSCLPSSFYFGWYFDGYDWYLDNQCSVRVRCIALSDGYNDCGSGCQRCVNESCQDYDVACSGCQHCSSDVCVNYCQGTDADCGCVSCTNCNASDGCVGTTYYNYYCSGTSCEYYSSPDDSRCVSCTSHDSYSCYGGDVYWYNSCSEKEEIKEDCNSCQQCLSGSCVDYCSGTDTDCGCSTCVNCNDSDGCVGNDYRDYYCNGTSCEVNITYDSGDCITCNSCQYYSEGSCYDYCEGIDTNCGCSSCVNCNVLDGCYEAEYRDYYCSGTSCEYHSSPDDFRCISCTSHDSYSCYESDVYWYNSCSEKEEIKQDCDSCQQCLSGSCVNYCQGEDTNCGCTDCVSCDDSDGWVDLEVSYSCCDGNKRCTCQDQEYRDYSCSGTSCTYLVTDTRVEKSECVECNPSEVCLDGICKTE